MKERIRAIDDLLRGRLTDRERLAESTSHLAVRRLLPSILALGAMAGLALGLFAVLTRDPATPLQLLSSAVKVPALYLLAFLVTFPSFLVFAALLRVPLRADEAGRILLAALLVNLAVLASFAPITAFFTVCTTSYPFLKLLDILFFAFAGAIGVGFLKKLFRNLQAARAEESRDEGEPEKPPPDPERVPASVRFATPRTPGAGLLNLWLSLYVVVAAQMAWVLRPLIGRPDEGFTWFMERGQSFLVDLSRTLAELFGSR